LLLQHLIIYNSQSLVRIIYITLSYYNLSVILCSLSIKIAINITHVE
jgi:hypothetical protein